MDNKTILNADVSVTEFDAENIQTDKEKARDGISGEDIHNASWGVKKVPRDPTRKDTVQDPETRTGR